MKGVAMKKNIKFILNGKPVKLNVNPDRMLLWILRTDLGLTGTKYGCGQSICGACTVLVNNEALRSCQTTIEEVEGKEVITIEGLAKDNQPHPLQKAFMDHDALQCGFCTPGMILTAYAFLSENPHPTKDQIIEAMDENLCRCGAHNRIVQAIESAAAEIERMGIK